MLRTAAVLLGATAFLGLLAVPATAAPSPDAVSAQGSVSGTPGDWNWRSTVQSQNGLANLAAGGNLCTGLVGVLAPANSCGG